MIRALIVGELRADPQQRTAKNGKPYALARLSVPMSDEGRLSCSLIAFEAEAVTRLLQLRAGASVAAAGALKVGTYEGSDGTTRASMDMVADEVAATTPRPRKPKPAPSRESHGRPGGAPAGDAFDDLSGAGDIDWMGA